MRAITTAISGETTVREHSIISEASLAAIELGTLKIMISSGIAVLQDSIGNLAKLLHDAPPGDDGNCGPCSTDPTEMRASAMADHTLPQSTPRSILQSELQRTLVAVQFDDMAMQLIDRVKERLARIEAAFHSGEPVPVPPLHSAADRAVDFRGDANSGTVELF